jgi:transcription elongation GreA/GreB family factor
MIGKSREEQIRERAHLLWFPKGKPHGRDTEYRKGREVLMSRAFVKEDAATSDVMDRPISPHANYVTAVGLDQIERALDAARQTHAAAQASGDRAELAKASSELRYWTARRGNAQLLVPDPRRNKDQFGSTVTIIRDGRKQTFQIVGEDEAEPANAKISYVSPLARALMSREAGDTAMFRESEIEIVATHSLHRLARDAVSL